MTFFSEGHFYFVYEITKETFKRLHENYYINT